MGGWTRAPRLVTVEAKGALRVALMAPKGVHRFASGPERGRMRARATGRKPGGGATTNAPPGRAFGRTLGKLTTESDAVRLDEVLEIELELECETVLVTKLDKSERAARA